MDLPRSGRTSRRQCLAGATLGALGLAWPPLVRAAHVLRPWPADKPVPPLALTDMAGKGWTLGALRGRAVMLNFWATWCEPCRAEMPSLERLAGRERDAGLTVLTVNYKEEVAAIRHFLSGVPIGLPILLDSDGEAAGAWTPRVFPSTVLIDRAGVPRQTVIGELDWSGGEARALVDRLLGS